MSETTTRIRTLAGHEYRAARRSKIIFGLIAIMVLATAVSVFIAAADYRSQIADYNAYIAAASANGVTQLPPPPLRLLSLLRGAMEYLEIIGAVIGIVLGYLSVWRERTSGTLSLIRSRPVTARERSLGSALGALGIIAVVVGATGLMSVLSLGLVGHGWPTAIEVLRLVLAYGFAVIYIEVFYLLGASLTARARSPINGLILALGIWLVVVLLLPQIGDTLDADNQVPGGLFASLSLDRAHEDLILSHFKTYEWIRAGIEELSLTKHFERFSFAMADVPAKYAGFSLPQLLRATRPNLLWMSFYPIALAAAFFQTIRHQPTFSKGDQS